MSDESYQMKVKYEILGGHTHIAIFTGKYEGTCGKAGDLCMTNEEFEAWRTGQISMQFIRKQST